MGSRDRDSKSLQDKLKVFFKKGPSAPLAGLNELVVTAELRRELCRETPLTRRLRAIKEVGEKVLHTRVQEGVIEKIWACTRDLLDEKNVEARHAALGLLRCIAEGPADLLIMRTILFKYLRETHEAHPPEDYQLRFKVLHALTNAGKNIDCVEEKIGPFILEWLPQIQNPVHTVEFIQLVINVVKFNAGYLDEEIVHGIVNHACYLCVYSSEQAVVQSCLSLLEAVVSYSILPRGALRTFVAALARTVNLEHYCQNSWKLMRCVVGADIGYAALQEMVEILVSAGEGGGGEGDEADAGLVRGAVFYINMALWGPRRVHRLDVSYLAVLPAFHKALRVRQPVVTYEVVVALQSLVTRAPLELHEPAWDALLHILRAILEQDKTFEPPNELIHSRLHDLITSIEQLHEAGQYQGDVDALFDLIDCCGHDRPEASTMRLISARAAALALGGAWASAALALGERYVRLERRLPVRLHAFAQLHAAIRRHGSIGAGEELAERVGVPLCNMCAQDSEPALRAAAARAATDLARLCQADACIDLVDLLEKILNRPFEIYAQGVAIPADADVSDARLAAAGLLALLHERLLRAPPQLAARALLVLLDHLDHCYRQPAIFHHHPDIRLQIFEMLFGLRANQLNCVGFCYDASGCVVYGPAALRLRPVCSPLLLVEPFSVRGQHHQTVKDLPPGACAVPGGRAARVLLLALTHEAEWAVLAYVLRALPHLLQARALALGRRAADLDLLAATLCSMVSERGGGGAGGGTGGRLPVSEFHAVALPALAALSSYHAFLEPQTQQRIVRCLLKYGMVLRTPQPFINALTLFTLETRETMVKMLPEVLLDLSKISDTKAIASPMLEFLSTLTRLPRVFASFVEDQYMSVFAILLPYTNPSRYNHYVVSLAHHVIAAWFLKCRLSYRRNFVRFIIHGLHNYIIMPFEEQMQYKTNNFQQPAGMSVNEDSSNRQRSSSVGSKAVCRPAGAPAAFHVELTETCVDLLARYTFTPCSVKPHRSDTAEFLFNGGQSTTWLVGHKLVTITTSGCLQNSIKQGLCDRCATLCRQHAESAASPLPPLLPPDDAPLLPAPQQLPNAPPVQVQVNDGAEHGHANVALANNHLQVHAQPAQGGAPEVKRYSKYSLQHSRSTETSCSSLSISELLPPSSGHTTRQNSAENKTTDPVVDALNQFSQRFEKISKDVDAEAGGLAGWSRVGALTAARACPCFCARWAELHVRSPTGDVSWLMRLQNQVSWSQVQEWPLQDVLALLSPPPLSDITTSSSSGLGDSRPELVSEGSPRSARASSASAATSASQRSQPPPADLHKSSSDSGVASERSAQRHAAASALGPALPPAASQPLRMSTQPINIPGSPQRQSSSSTTDEDDMLLIVPEGKSRHPVRRSNSSPEMSSSWKVTSRPEPCGAAQQPPDPLDMILLPACSVETTNTSMSLHATKKPPKKSDMRVSCEAIPEEMCGTSPQPPAPPAPAPPPAPHPHLMTYNSDPGTVGSDADCDLHATADGHHPHHQLQKTRSDSTVSGGGGGGGGAGGAGGVGREREELPPLARSKRSNTISVMSPTRRNREAARNAAAAGSGAGAGGGAASAGVGGGVSPSFAFLQLYHNMSTYPISPPVPGEAVTQLNPLTERPLKLSGVQHERTIKNLDLVPPLDTYKVGVLYVGPGQQDKEVAILKNEYGSVRYSEFLRALGALVPLSGARDEPNLFLALDTAGRDGLYTYVWSDDIVQVVFHVATAMPSCANDPSCNEKRKYIGNDYVSIVYNDSGADFNIHTIKGQFNLCIVVVEPLEHGMNLVSVRTKDERIRTKFLAHLGSSVVSDHNAPVLARQQALHCALASQISQSLKTAGSPYASNSLERLRIIKRLRARAQDERLEAAARAPAPYAAAPQRRRVAIDDFNDYT